MSEPNDWLAPAVEIACRAGELIMEVYRGQFDVEHKEDASPLTQADMASHHHIIEALQALSPEVPCLSEEAADIPFEERSRWQRYWLVDPLDGTREFIKQNGEFTVNIALIEKGEPVLGVVHAPALDVSYFAAAGQGAWKRVGAAPARSIKVRRIPDAAPVRVLVSRSHGSEAQARVLSHLGDYVDMSIGSSLKFCLIAEGEADLYPRLGPTSEWDTGAAHAVLREAGGRVVDTEFSPLRYNTKPSVLNPFFVAWGDPDYDWQRYLEPALADERN